MDVTEFAFGIILTIIGVVAAEYCIHYFKGKKVIHTLINSIGYEVCENLAILEDNLKKLQERKKEGYIPFTTISYYNFKQSMSDELIKKLGNEAIISLFIGYIYCINFNNNLHLIPSSKNIHSIHSARKECIQKIKTNFDKFQE
ncbi:unnamed protein product, partial [marine sediment metagenome]